MMSKRQYELRKRKNRVLETRIRTLFARIMEELRESRAMTAANRNAHPRILLGNLVRVPNRSVTTLRAVAAPSQSMMQPIPSTSSAPTAPTAPLPSRAVGQSSRLLSLSRQGRVRGRSSPIERLCTMKAAYYTELIKLEKEKLKLKREKLEQYLIIENQKLEVLKEKNKIFERYIENNLPLPSDLK